MSKHRAGDPLGMPDIVLTRDIAPGEFFTYTAPRPTDRVRIIGNIGEGADVTITAAECELMGNVADNCRVTFELPKAGGAAAAFNALAGPRDGLIIDGTVGENVVLASQSGLRVRKNSGTALLAIAAGDVRLAHVGARAKISAGRDAVLTGVGAASRVQAGARLNITFVGEKSTLKARQIIGAKATSLPYICPQQSRDVRMGAKTTHFYNGQGIARLKSW